jgi:glycosyltransferase involved in cell wall biosynthesis
MPYKADGIFICNNKSLLQEIIIMVHRNISKFVLTLGCYYKKPTGGISKVLNEYSKIFDEFHFIATTKRVNKFFIICIAVLAYFKLFFVLLLRQYEIVHIHSASYNSFWRKSLYISLANFMKKKTICHIHGGGFRLFYHKNEARVKKILAKCDVIVALSESWKMFFENEVGCKNVVIINNIIPYPKIKIVKKTVEICYLLFLGMIEEKKGIFDLLDTIKINKTNFEGRIKLFVCGEGETERLKNFIRDNLLDNLVEYKGWVANEDKEYLLSMADIYILPSYIEGLPISILEAMSYSLPIISTPVGGIPEIVTDNVNGFLIEPGNKKQIKEAIEKLIYDGNLRREMGEKSHQCSIDFFPVAVEKQLQNIYKNLLTGII